MNVSTVVRKNLHPNVQPAVLIMELLIYCGILIIIIFTGVVMDMVTIGDADRDIRRSPSQGVPRWMTWIRDFIHFHFFPLKASKSLKKPFFQK